jgi:NCAIR mutase (PurE)-related protein
VDRADLHALLTAVADGRTSVDEAQQQLGTAALRGFTDLGFARLDSHRGLRTGDP